MVRHALGGLLLLALAVWGAASYATADFTITRDVAPVRGEDQLLSDFDPTPQRVRIACGDDGGQYQTDDGQPMAWPAITTVSYLEGDVATELCDDARAERRQTAAAIGLLGLLACLGLVMAGRVRQCSTQPDALSHPVEPPPPVAAG
jgi:hypothetical protein